MLFLSIISIPGPGRFPGHSFLWIVTIVMLLPVFLLEFLSRFLVFPKFLIEIGSALIYLYFISCLIVYFNSNYRDRVRKLWQERIMGKIIIIGFILVTISTLSLSIYFDIKSRESLIDRFEVKRIVAAIHRAETLMDDIYRDNKNYDSFKCTHQEMTILCQEIDANYKPEDGKEPIIIHDKPIKSQAACIYAPLNREKTYWYCADSSGRAGYTTINPGSHGYCVEGESAVCPPFVGM
jgi:hypothetical protein